MTNLLISYCVESSGKLTLPAIVSTLKIGYFINSSILNGIYGSMSLLTAAILIKKKFTIDELVRNYYANVDVFSGSWY